MAQNIKVNIVLKYHKLDEYCPQVGYIVAEQAGQNL